MELRTTEAKRKLIEAFTAWVMEDDIYACDYLCEAREAPSNSPWVTKVPGDITLTLRRSTPDLSRGSRIEEHPDGSIRHVSTKPWGFVEQM